MFMKSLHDDIEGNKTRCHQILNRCISFEMPLRQLLTLPSLSQSKASNLPKLHTLLRECLKYCDKFSKKTWVSKAITSVFTGFEFKDFNNRITEMSQDLQLEVLSVQALSQQDLLRDQAKMRDDVAAYVAMVELRIPSTCAPADVPAAVHQAAGNASVAVLKEVSESDNS